MTTYRTVPHTVVPNLPAQVLALAQASFMQFPGVSRPSADKADWYLARPRMSRDLSLAAMHGETMVANVYVTLDDIQLGGETLRCGIIDTVMTHPDHRRRGLARALMARTLESMVAAGAHVSLLYTLPDSMQQRFYHALGYRDVGFVHYVTRQQGESQSVARATPVDKDDCIAFANACHTAHDGYVPLDDALWRWRRVGRPTTLPSDTRLVRQDSRIVALGSYCAAPIIGADGRQVVVLTDFCWEESDAGRAGAVNILDGAPTGCELRVLAGREDTARLALLQENGLDIIGGETAMIKPLIAAGEQALGQIGPRWYPLVESIIGV